MNANDNERQSGAVDQDEFEEAIRNNLSPDGVAAIIAFLQPAQSWKPSNEQATQALRQVEWFADTLLGMLGVDEFNHLMDELGL